MRKRLYLFVISICVLGVLFNPEAKAQQAQQTISHQGVLFDSEGNPVEDDTYIFSFKIYADSSGGTALWTSDKILSVNNGTYNAQLGSENPLNLPFDQKYWVGVAIDGGSELEPRLPLSAAPYAMHAYTISDSSVTNAKLANGSVTTEKLAESIELSNYTTIGNLNWSSVEVSDSWTELAIGSSPRTFQKQFESSKIELTLRSRIISGSFSGASWIRYQLRIDGNAGDMSVPHYIFSSNTTEYVTLKAVFENLSAGQHTVEVWAITDAGTSSDVYVDPGGYRGKIFIRESR